MDDSPRLLSIKNESWIDRPLVDGKSDLKELPEWLKLVEGLDSSYHQRFILAVRLYHRAILLIEEQPDMAYLNLISAIEVLCHEMDIGEIKLIDLDKELAKLVNSVENADLRNNIEQAILKREHFISRRFVAFILAYIEDNFWTDGKKPEHGQIKPDKLPDLLKRIYKQRSNTLHLGEPFPPSIFSSPMMEADIDFTLGFINGERKWEPKDFIPHPHFFERLVNHVFRNFVKRNQIKRENVDKPSSNSGKIEG